MRRPSVVLINEYRHHPQQQQPVERPPAASDNDDCSCDAAAASMVGSASSKSPAGSVDASFTAALTSAICSAASNMSTTPPMSTISAADVPSVTAESHSEAEATREEQIFGAEGSEIEDAEFRRKWLVLVCSIGLAIAFNFIYVLTLVINQLAAQHRLLCGLPWSTLSLGDAILAPMSENESESENDGSLDSQSECVFAVFALLCNAYHLSLIVLLYRTRRLFLVAALFLIYIDVGICGACIYFGILSEFYMWLAAVVAMAYYIFGRHISRVFLIAVLLEGVLLYPCSVYVFPPVAPLSMDATDRLTATCTMIMCVGIISHIHESSRQATVDRLRDFNEKLRRSTEAKTLFLSAITHELRTPLTGIIGMANELLLEDEDKAEQQPPPSRPASPAAPDQDQEQCHLRGGSARTQAQSDEERMEAVRIIVTCARHLLGLVNDVLDFEKIESRQLDLEAIPFDVEKETDLVLSMLAFPAASSRVRIEKQTAGLAPGHRFRVGDPLRFRQVLFNLLSNAVKFTPAMGTVTLLLGDAGDDADTTDADTTDASSLRVEVRDTGIGIPETTMKNLFKHFSQGGTGVCRQYGGSGLGLAICKHLVEAMHGRIGCSSAGVNKGSTFWFTLPLPVSSPEAVGADCDSTQVAACDLAGSQPEAPPVSPGSGGGSGSGSDVPHPQQARHSFEGMKVLLVEDNVVNQKVGRRLLERIGCDVHVAENGQECIDMLERESFSLIFMDCQMPVLDGYEATRRIREMERAEQRGRTPIVALTASCVKSDRQVCLDSGMDDWMSKPFDQGALCRALLKWVPRPPHSQAER